MNDIHIIEQPEQYCTELQRELHLLGRDAVFSSTLKRGLTELKLSSSRLLVLNSRLTDGDSIDRIAELRQKSPSLEIIIISDAPTAEEAESSVKNGAWDYLEKPESAKDLALILDRAFQYSLRRTSESRQIPPDGKRFEGKVGDSPEIRSCLNLVPRPQIAVRTY